MVETSIASKLTISLILSRLYRQYWYHLGAINQYQYQLHVLLSGDISNNYFKIMNKMRYSCAPFEKSASFIRSVYSLRFFRMQIK